MLKMKKYKVTNKRNGSILKKLCLFISSFNIYAQIYITARVHMWINYIHLCGRLQRIGGNVVQ